MRPLIDRGGGIPVNWVAALILLGTAPLIPLFMAMVGMGAADANRRNFQALARLSGHFLDRLRGMETLRIFGRGEAETESIRAASQDFRQRTMEVLRLAFLSSGVLEFLPPCPSHWSRFTSAFPTLANWILDTTAQVSHWLPASSRSFWRRNFSSPARSGTFITPKHKPLVQQTV
ncbi:ABC transporter transmembrane domain-containing protein [Shigella flexneri]